MQLAELFSPDHIIAELHSTTKAAVFREMVNFLVTAGAISDSETVLNTLLQRESVMSTLITPNIALPHASMRHFDGTVGAFGISREGIDYEVKGGSSVNIVLMLIDDRSQSEDHLELLKQTAKMIDTPNFINRILECETAEEVHELILEVETLQRR